MKKLKLEELNLGYAEVLSREELKKVLGGMGSGGSGGGSGAGCCCAHGSYNGFDVYYCGMHKDSAQQKAQEIDGKWCCDSCPQSMHPCTP